MNPENPQLHDDSSPLGRVRQMKMEQARRLIVEQVELHERADHGGKPCPTERLNVVAFLCHVLGVRGAALRELPQAVAEYDARCKDPSCAHLRN